MVLHWDLAAVVIALIALPLAMSPIAVAFLQYYLGQFARFLWPAKGRCERLEWSDVPPGVLHACDLTCRNRGFCYVSDPHVPVRCWEGSIYRVLNQAWGSPARQGRYARKPSELYTFRDYVRTDAETLKAFMIVAAARNETSLTVEIPDLNIKTLDATGRVAVHIMQPVPGQINNQLTKAEVEHMVRGFPPFYRQMLRTTAGIELDHPIKKPFDVGRGGWVLAVGMCLLDYIPPLHNMPDRNGATPDPWRSTLVLTAMTRINHVLELLKGRLPSAGAEKAEEAITCFHVIMNREHCSDPWSVKTARLEQSELFQPLFGSCPCTTTCMGRRSHTAICGRGQHMKKDPAKTLSRAECKAAMELFSNYQPLDENLAIIMPVIVPVLQTTILGVSEVEHYFSQIGRKIDFPPVLERRKYIYLRDCQAEDGYR